MKNNHWLSFLSGALIGAGITWFLSSKEGKELVEQAVSGANNLKEKVETELADLNEQIRNRTDKQKTS